MTLPPGRARLATRPAPTGSGTFVITMGMVVVAFFAANAAVVPATTIRSTLRRTKSAASSGRRSGFCSRKPVLDGDILSLNPSKLAQLLPKRLQEDRATGSSAWIQETDAEDFPCLLRVTWTTSASSKDVEYEDQDIFFFMRFFSLLAPSPSLSNECHHDVRVQRQCFSATSLILRPSDGRRLGFGGFRVDAEEPYSTFPSGEESIEVKYSRSFARCSPQPIQPRAVVPENFLPAFLRHAIHLQKLFHRMRESPSRRADSRSRRRSCRRRSDR